MADRVERYRTTTGQLFRLLWIDAHLEQFGSIRRVDVCGALGVSIPQAATDFRLLRTIWPGRMAYDARAKCYKATSGAVHDAALLASARHVAAGVQALGDQLVSRSIMEELDRA